MMVDSGVTEFSFAPRQCMNFEITEVPQRKELDPNNLYYRQCLSEVQQILNKTSGKTIYKTVTIKGTPL